MTFVWNESARRQVATISGRCDQRHFWNDLRPHIAQTHTLASQHANLFQPPFEFLIAVELGGSFVAGFSEVCSTQNDHRHAVIDQGCFDAVEFVQRMARRQQCAAHRAGGIEEIDANCRRGPRHARDCSLSVISDIAARRRHVSDSGVSGVHHVDPDWRNWIAPWNEAALNRKRAHAGQHIPAVRRDVDERSIDGNLREEIVDIDTRPRGTRNDCHLAGQGVGATNPVDLARIGRSHDGEQHAIAQLDLVR